MRSFDEFAEELEEAGVDVLVDVRETPWSRKKGFSKKALVAGLEERGIEYFHARFAGNPRHLRKTAPSHDAVLDAYEEYLDDEPHVLREFGRFVEEHAAKGSRICLMCYERHPGDCHRSVLIDAWVERTGADVDVVHLGPSGCKRFGSREVVTGVVA
jgi:uncharacterized protein (DUF488 family)